MNIFSSLKEIDIDILRLWHPVGKVYSENERAGTRGPGADGGGGTRSRERDGCIATRAHSGEDI